MPRAGVKLGEAVALRERIYTGWADDYIIIMKAMEKEIEINLLGGKQ